MARSLENQPRIRFRGTPAPWLPALPRRRVHPCPGWLTLRRESAFRVPTPPHPISPRGSGQYRSRSQEPSRGARLPCGRVPVSWPPRRVIPGGGSVLKVLRKGSRAVLWVVIIGVGAVFVLYLGFQGGFSPARGGGPVVRVGDVSFEG